MLGKGGDVYQKHARVGLGVLVKLPAHGHDLQRQAAATGALQSASRLQASCSN